MRTFLDSFPHVMIWYFPPVGRFAMSNTFLVGSNERIDIDPSWMRQAMERDPAAFQGMRKYGLATADTVLAHFIATEETIRPAFPPGPVNSFERPYYEFYSPRDYAVPSTVRALANHELLMSFRGKEFDRVVSRGADGPDIARLNAAFRAEGAFFEGYALQLQGKEGPAILPFYEKAISAAPGNMNLRNEMVSYLNSEVRAYYQQGDNAGAAALLRQAAGIYPEGAEVHYDYGMMLLFLNDTAQGVAELERTLELNPKYIPALRNLGVVFASRGDMDKAQELWRKALVVDPDDIGTLVLYGSYLVEQRSSAGMEYLTRAYRLAPENPAVIDRYKLGINLMHGR